MGKLIHLPLGEDDGSTAQLLARVGQAYREQVTAQTELPRALAALVRAGQIELALQGIVQWGERSQDPAQILRHCRAALRAEPCGDAGK